MKVHCSEGLASHIGPELCAVPREGFSEALVGVRLGWVLSRERPIRGADVVETAEGHMGEREIASAFLTPRGLRPQHDRKLLVREPGGLMPDRPGRPARIGKVRSRSQ